MSSSEQTPNSNSHPTDSSSSRPSSGGTFGKRGKSFPPACPLSKKPKIADSAAKIQFITEFLECGVCLDFPASPIYSCANAHFLCSQCAPKLGACPTCRNPKLRPSPACDKLAKEANQMVECPNSEAGCKMSVLSTKLQDHLPQCFFREINCDFEGNCGAQVKFHEYAKHLEEIHNEKVHIGPKFTDILFVVDKLPPTASGWSPLEQCIIKFDNQHFILHAQVSKVNELFFSWVSILGDKELAKQYRYEAKFEDSKNPRKHSCCWRLGVLPFHEISGTESGAQLIEFLSVSAIWIGAIKKWAEWDENFGLPYVNVTYEIKKVSAS